jgi:catalase
VREDLVESAALSILKNGPERFAGRKIGVLLADGSDAGLLKGLESAASAEGAIVELLGPRIGGIRLNDDAERQADEQIGGAPSVLYDAVVLLMDENGASRLSGMPPARDFVSDAFAHGKFVGYVASAGPLLDAAGVSPDEGFVLLDGSKACESLLTRCRELRYWER